MLASFLFVAGAAAADFTEFKGHQSAVRSVGFSPDGKKIVSGGNDRTVRVWEVESGKELLVLKGHPTDVYSVAFSPDGTVIADSHTTIETTGSYSNREEVYLANPNTVTISTRHSETLNRLFVYASLLMPDGNVLRLAHTYTGWLEHLLVQLPTLLIIIVIVLGLSLIWAKRYTKAITEPLEKIVDALATQDYDLLESHQSPYHEIEKLMHSSKLLLERIKEERERVEIILSNMSEGFILVDNERNILLCNVSARQFFGLDKALKINSIENLSHSTTITNALQDAILNERSSVFELVIATDLFVRFHVSPTIDSGAVILIVDITDEKKLEQRKQEFFSNASHELKTPITSILGFSEMLNSGIVDNNSESRNDIVNRIEAEAKRLSELINYILTVSRLESKQTNENRIDVNFGDVVKEATASLENTNIQILLDVDDVIFRADKRHLQQICENLIENAVKYNKPNGTVNVSLKEDANKITLCVEDTGVGISQEHQSRLFDRFFRVDYGRDKRSGGSGLGLSIVKHTVGLYGGKISLKSKPDVGTEIVIEFPR
jgi:two-component system phosphate regulon sensor histidine kinase PhoR